MMNINTCRSTMTTGNWRALGLCALLGVITLCSMSGCYRRVVGAKGLGASQYDIEEPYQENSQVDDWIFGEQKPKNNMMRSTGGL